MRCDGRLDYPLNLPPYCKAFRAFSMYTAIMRHLSEIPVNRLHRSWFDRTADWSIDSERALSPKRLPEAQFRANSPFIFYYLMRNYWEGFGF